MQQLSKDILKAVGVRFIVNPELGHKGVTETDEMCQRTIDWLRHLDETHPRCVLMADTKNKDPHAVMVRAMGKLIAYLDKSQAPEVRGMLKTTQKGMIMTTIESVKTDKHGYFFLKKPVVTEPYTPEDIGVDWSQYCSDEMMLLPDDYLLSHDELSMVIFDVLLPDMANVPTEELKDYLTQWLQSVRYNQSREVQKEMKELIARLSADERMEVRAIAADIDHMRTKKGTKEMAEEMADVWWKGIIESETVNESFTVVKQRCMNEDRQLLSMLDNVEHLMQSLPGELYNDAGDAFRFFQHMNYLAPPVTALRGVMSLFALRTLLCRELGLGLEPFFGNRQKSVTDLKLMPTTIGKVIEFANEQCREYAETLTVQRLVSFLRDDYEKRRNKEIEQIVSRKNPEAGISIGVLNGTLTGAATQHFGEPSTDPRNETQLLANNE